MQGSLFAREESVAVDAIDFRKLPQFFAYQGSKRKLARQIFEIIRNKTSVQPRRFFEPFCGSGAMSVAFGASNSGVGIVISDAFETLCDLWREVLNNPSELADSYSEIWQRGLDAPREAFLRVREEFNRDPNPAQLLYLLTRCVKNSPRFNSNGEFNQSADNRRLGRSPSTMREQIMRTNQILAGVTCVRSGDFRETTSDAECGDWVYLDPPYQGVVGVRDPRYFAGVSVEEIEEFVADLHQRGAKVILSYDGSCGDVSYGRPLRDGLGLEKYDIHAGRSTQQTLNGKAADTIEALYVSRDFS